MRLTAEEGRVLGALVEKELTTPQGYPLTDNALLAACNQTTSRDPVVSYDLAVLRTAVRSLREQGLLRTVHRPGERSEKHRHELPSALDLSAEQVALLAVLLLRGAQTAAELRARSERMRASTTEDVERVLAELAQRGLAQRLERQPGRKEARWVQLLAPADAPASDGPVSDGPVPPPEVVADAVLRALVDALRTRDLVAAAAVFADDALLLGSGREEVAAGAAEVHAFLSRLLARPDTVGWEWDAVEAGGQGGTTWFHLPCELVTGDLRLPYRLSGVVVERDGAHVLAQLHGSRPAD